MRWASTPGSTATPTRRPEAALTGAGAPRAARIHHGAQTRVRAHVAHAGRPVSVTTIVSSCDQVEAVKQLTALCGTVALEPRKVEAMG